MSEESHGTRNLAIVGVLGIFVLGSVILFFPGIFGGSSSTTTSSTTSTGTPSTILSCPGGLNFFGLGCTTTTTTVTSSTHT